MRYHLGGQDSTLTIRDFRKNPNQALQNILSGNKNTKFFSYFNIPARVKIQKDSHGIHIELQECNEQNISPVLWLGVLNGDKMPIHRIRWQTLKPLDDNRTAFVAIVED